MRQKLYRLLKNRKDLESLAILQEHPDICDNNVIRFALDNRCFKTIAYLRELDVITLEGKQEREEARIEDMNCNLEKFEQLMEELDSYMSENPEDSTWKTK